MFRHVHIVRPKFLLEAQTQCMVSVLQLSDDQVEFLVMIPKPTCGVWVVCWAKCWGASTWRMDEKMVCVCVSMLIAFFVLIMLACFLAADQMNCILQFIGTPSEEDIACIENQYARAHIRSTSYKRPDWSTIFPKASKDALDLLDKLLAFNPKKRISAAEALAHPFVKRYSQPETEPECVRPRPADYFSAAEAPEEVLRAYAWKEVYKFHPELDPSKQQKAQPMDVVQEKINDDSKQSDIDVQ